MICCFLRARRAESFLGRASASSLLFVCSDWVPPNTAAVACYVVLTVLLSISLAASVDPAVWV